MKRTLIFTAGFLIIALIALQINTSDVSFTEESEETAVFKGLDLSCSDCEEQVESALAKIIGIKNYQINPNAGTLTITYETDDMQAEWIANSLEAAGFPVEEIEKVKK